jgi:hypothetical protein
MMAPPMNEPDAQPSQVDIVDTAGPTDLELAWAASRAEAALALRQPDDAARSADHAAGLLARLGAAPEHRERAARLRARAKD